MGSHWFKVLVCGALLLALDGTVQAGMTTKAPLSTTRYKVTLDLGSAMVFMPKRISGGAVKNDVIQESQSVSHAKMKHFAASKTKPYIFYGVHLTSAQRQSLAQSFMSDKNLGDGKRTTVLIEWLDTTGKALRKVRLMNAGLSSLKEEKPIKGSSEPPLCDLTFYYEESKNVP
jgi:hypothetical protein